jgi:hypothetical protein
VLGLDGLGLPTVLRIGGSTMGVFGSVPSTGSPRLALWRDGRYPGSSSFGGGGGSLRDMATPYGMAPSLVSSRLTGPQVILVRTAIWFTGIFWFAT